MSPKYKLIYFPVMGTVEPIRLLFALARVDYEDERLNFQTEWPSRKQEMPWGTLPVFYEDDKVFCQTLAILRYLGRKFGRAGSTDFETAKIDEYVDAMDDIRLECAKVFFEEDKTKKGEMEKRLKEIVMPPFVDKIEKLLKENESGVLVGKELTYADLFIAHWLNMVQKDLSNHPQISKHREIVFNNPNIKEYVQKRPLTEH